MKQPAGEGSIMQLPNGVWRGQIMDGYRQDGKRNIITFTGQSKKEIQTQIRSYWYHKELFPVAMSHHITFGEWGETWYEDYKSQVQASTHAGYRYTLNVLLEHFGPFKLRDIRPLQINRFLDNLKARDLSHSYISKCRSMLIQIFDEAEANELVTQNPARKSKPVKKRTSSTFCDDEEDSKKDAFTDFEIDGLRKGLPNDKLGNSILLMLGTGMRTQELLALTAKDIAQDGSYLTINKAIKMVDGVPKLGPPKSARGRRTIPVPEVYRPNAIFLLNHTGNPYIWTSQRDDGLFDVGAFRKRYYRALKKIPGVRLLSPHCCRHTYISNLEKHGVPIELIARLAGHSRIATTDGYLHTDLATLTRATSVLNQSI